MDRLLLMASLPPVLFLTYRLAVLGLAWRIFARTGDPKSLKQVSRLIGSRGKRD